MTMTAQQPAAVHMTPTAPPPATDATLAAEQLQQLLGELRRVIVGQDRVLERVIVALLAGGHCLLEGVPGLGKTLTVSSLASTLGGTFTRIQFTPDLLPSDIVGTRVYRPSTERFDVELGPVFANFVLADEINRAPAKVQSALLEVMAERQVSLGGVTYPLPQPFLVLATQNPIESEGVYPLPEAQRDRFLMRIPVDYPTAHEEHEIVNRARVDPVEPAMLLSTDDVLGLQAAAGAVDVDPVVQDYAVRLVLATRDPKAHGVDIGESARLRRQPACQHRSRPRRSSARPAARPRPPAAPGRVRRRLRRAQPSAGALLRRGRRRRDGRRRAGEAAHRDRRPAAVLIGARLPRGCPAQFVAPHRHEHHRSSPRRTAQRGGASPADDQAHLALRGAHRPAAAHRGPPPRRAAGRRPCRAVPRPRHRARRGPTLRARRRPPPHRLGRHGPHQRPPRTRHDRRPRARAVARARHVVQPRVRDRPVHQARVGVDRGGRARPARQPRWQPHRCRRLW